MYILLTLLNGAKEPVTLIDLQALYKKVSDTERYNEQSDIVAFINDIIQPADAHRQVLVDSHNRAVKGITDDIQAKRLQAAQQR